MLIVFVAAGERVVEGHGFVEPAGVAGRLEEIEETCDHEGVVIEVAGLMRPPILEAPKQRTIHSHVGQNEVGRAFGTLCVHWIIEDEARARAEIISPFQAAMIFSSRSGGRRLERAA